MKLWADAKATIDALSPPEGFIAYATDTNEIGSYDGAAWTWIPSGSLDARYLRLNAVNDPITAGLEINAATADEPVLILQTTDDNAANSIQEWQDSSANVFSHVLAGGELIQYKQTVAKTGAYTATVNDEVIFCDVNGGAFTITLPASSGNAGLNFHIKKTDSSGNAVTIDGNASETIDGDLTVDITDQYESLHLVCDGNNWHVL